MPDKGLRDFKRSLEIFDKKIRNKVIKNALKKALKPLAARLKVEAPNDTGTMESSIKIKVGKRKKNKIVYQVDISTPEDEAYAGRSEFGTKDHPAHPWIRPSAKNLRGEMIETFIDELEKGINNL